MRKDHLLHLLAGFVLAYVPSILITLVDTIEYRLTLGLIVGAAISLGATFAKDFIWDKWMGRGVFEWFDILYGVIGCVIGLGLTLITVFYLI
jgi:hypothetical protein